MPEPKLPNDREAVIMDIISSKEEMYGLEIRDEYEARTRRRMPLGSLYTTLLRMEEDKGFINSRMGEPRRDRGGRRRKYFKLTRLGEAALNEYELRLASVWGKPAVVGLVRGRPPRPLRGV